MSAKYITPQEADTLSVIKELLSANPKDIAAAHEEARRQIALTEEETRKANEGREFIAKHKVLADDLAAREQALQDEKAAQAEKELNFAALTDSKAKELDDKERELIKREQDLATLKAQQDTAAAKLAADQAALATLSRDIKEHHLRQEETNATLKNANEAEAARLKSLAAELKLKAQKQLDSF